MNNKNNSSNSLVLSRWPQTTTQMIPWSLADGSRQKWTVRKKKFKSGSVIYFFHLINAHVMELSLAGVRFLNNDSKISNDGEDKIKKKTWDRTEKRMGFWFLTFVKRKYLNKFKALDFTILEVGLKDLNLLALIFSLIEFTKKSEMWPFSPYWRILYVFGGTWLQTRDLGPQNASWVVPDTSSEIALLHYLQLQHLELILYKYFWVKFNSALEFDQSNQSSDQF